MFTISEGAVTSSTIDAQNFYWCLSFLTADQKPVFLLSEKDFASFSRTRWSFCRLIRRTDALYCLLVLFLILKRAPEEGRPASSQTLYQKSASFFRSWQLSFQPTSVGEEDDLIGKQCTAQEVRVETNWFAYSSRNSLWKEQSTVPQFNISTGKILRR